MYYSTNVFFNALMWCLHDMQDGTSWNVYMEHRIGYVIFGTWKSWTRTS